MKKTMLFLLVVTTIFVLNGCAKVYHSPNADVRTSTHEVIAIVPPKVSIAAQRKVDAEAIKEQQKTEAINFQREIYNWLLHRKTQNRIFVEVQDVETTNAKLKKAGYFDDNPMSPAEMAEALDVDAVITSNFALTKPMSTGGAIALGLIVGIWGPTNTSAVTVEIHDKETKKLLWNFNHRISGSVGSSPGSLVDHLMRKASRKMPYTR